MKSAFQRQKIFTKSENTSQLERVNEEFCFALFNTRTIDEKCNIMFVAKKLKREVQEEVNNTSFYQYISLKVIRMSKNTLLQVYKISMDN